MRLPRQSTTLTLDKCNAVSYLLPNNKEGLPMFFRRSKIRTAASVTLLCASVFFGWLHSANAEETDQFTLPPTALVDVGPLVSQRVYGAIEKALKQTNDEIQDLIKKAVLSPADKNMASELTKRRSDAYIMNLVYKQTGTGLPEATYERWLNWDSFPDIFQPMRFNEIRPWATIYWGVFSQAPLALTILSPTINMYGHYFGTDKIGHFFQQGEGYYSIYMKVLAQGKSVEQAHQAIVAHGQFEEHGIFGTALDGVYSNGDLSANYGGWKFYMNLAHSVRIGSQELLPLLILHNDRWEFARNVKKDDLLKPFINDNLNEAWNPCRYSFEKSLIRKHVEARCKEWIDRLGINKESVAAKLQETSLWEGEDYGHWLPQSDTITLETCFGGL